MSDLREAAQRALDALEELNGWQSLAPPLASQAARQAAINLRAALEQPVQEPVAWIHTDPDKPRVCFLEWRENEQGYRGDWIKTPLFNHPPRRKWRWLSEEEITDGREQLPTEDLCGWSFRQGVEFAEAALKERNA